MEPAAIRYKNPGAMWGKGNPIAVKWGMTRVVMLNDGLGQGNNIAEFPTWVAGICAQLDLWRTSPHYKNKRFADAIATWSGHNNVPSYIAYVKARVPGMTENTIMDGVFWNSSMGIAFLKAQAGHEAGKPMPCPAEDWITAQRKVMGGQVPVAPAAKKTAATAVVANTTTSAVAVQAAHSGWPWWIVVLVIAAGIGITIGAAYFFHRQETPEVQDGLE